MSVLLKLCEDLSREILFQWIEACDLCRLDTAVTCGLRLSLINLLIGNKLHFKTKELIYYFSEPYHSWYLDLLSLSSPLKYCCFYAWMHVRGIKPVQLTLDSRFIDSTTDYLKFDVDLSSVQVLVVKDNARSFTLRYINQCSSLQYLDIQLRDAFLLLDQPPSNCIGIRLDFSYGTREDTVAKKLLMFRNLTSLVLTTVISSDRFTDVIVNNPGLHEVHIKSLDLTILKAVTQHCSLIQHLYLSFPDEFLKDSLLSISELLTMKSVYYLSIYNEKFVYQEPRIRYTRDNEKGKEIRIYNIAASEQFDSFLVSLTNFSIIGIPYCSGEISIASAVANSQTTLTSLDIDAKLGFEAINHVVTHCRSLTSFKLSTWETCDSLLVAFASEPRLKSIHITFYGPHPDLSSVMELLVPCPHMMDFVVVNALYNSTSLAMFKNFFNSFNWQGVIVFGSQLDSETVCLAIENESLRLHYIESHVGW